MSIKVKKLSVIPLRKREIVRKRMPWFTLEKCVGVAIPFWFEARNGKLAGNDFPRNKTEEEKKD